MARLNSSGRVCRKRAKTVAMASLTHTSIGPKRSSTAAAAASTWPGSLTSVGTTSACAAERADLLGGRVETGLPAGEQPEVGAAFGEGVRDRASDPAGGAGDDDHLGLGVFGHDGSLG